MRRGFFWLTASGVLLLGIGLRSPLLVTSFAADPPAKQAPAAKKAAGDAPLEKVPATDNQITDLDRRARQQDTAAEALSVYDRYLATHTLSSKQQARIEVRHKYWQAAVKEGLIRAGDKWLLPEKAEALAEEAEDLIEQAWELALVEGDTESRKLLEKASKVDPAGIRADFTLGLFNSVISRHPPTAKEHFREVLRREPNLIAALNNLALSEMKLGEYTQALDHWQEAAALAPRAPAVTQNVGRLIQEATRKELTIPVRDLTKYTRFYAAMTAGGKGKPADPKVGWLYMPLYLNKSETLPATDKGKGKLKGKEAQLVSVGSGTGFLVHNGYILTCGHVAEDAAAFGIIHPAHPNVEWKASLVAMSLEDDLALLKCDDAQGPPVEILSAAPRRGTDIMVLGFPLGEELGRGLKSTRGSISALPDPSHDGMLLYDATTNPGNSGGPVCDSSGRVLAVHAAGINSFGKYGGGVPAEKVIPFLEEHLPQFQHESTESSRLDWPDVDEKVSRSTLLILKYQAAVQVAWGKQSTNSADPYEDRCCSHCFGLAVVSCPVKGCTRGKVTAKVAYQETVGRDEFTKVITKYRNVKQACKQCQGTGSVNCPKCKTGEDPDL